MSTTGLVTSPLCKRCSTPLSPGILECLHCHALVHADELQLLSTQAQLLEAQGKFCEARQRWESALPLLPADAQQALWIKNHAIDLSGRAFEAETAQQQKRAAEHQWAKKFGPLAPLLLFLTKAKSLLVLLKFKFLFSLFAFVSFYWAIYGKWFGIGFAALILCHEMGHFIEVRRRHLPVELPVFLPGIGAYVKWKNLGVPAEGRSMIALAGPLAGLLSSAICLAVYWQTHSTLWLALAHTGAWLNLLNLVPVWVLDGGHAMEAVNRTGRILLCAIAAITFYFVHDIILVAIAGGCAWQAFLRPTSPQGSILQGSAMQGSSIQTTTMEGSSAKITAYFAILVCALAALVWLTPAREIAHR